MLLQLLPCAEVVGENNLRRHDKQMAMRIHAATSMPGDITLIRRRSAARAHRAPLSGQEVVIWITVPFPAVTCAGTHATQTHTYL